MTFTKLGLVFRPSGEPGWQRSHASLPVPLVLGDGTVRIFFASRDERNRSHVGFVDMELGRRPRVVGMADAPVLAPGPLGGFDDHGVYPASVVPMGSKLLLYYVGWSPGAEPPLFYASVGLAVSEDGGRTFERASPAPILSRSEHDPCLVTSPCVLRERSEWRMWYVSGFRWERVEGHIQSYYDIKYAQSADGVTWIREGVVAIGLQPGERNIGRPCVVRDGDSYRMWYSRSDGSGYRPGYAESSDGITWERHDADAGIDISTDGWDSEAIAYPWAFQHGDRWYLLYNGNQYGRDGFGLAVAT